MRFKAVIFDLDGTLVNSIHGIAYSMNTVLTKHGLPGHSTETYETFVGNGLLELVKRSIPGKVNDETLQKYFIEMIKEYTISWSYKMYIYDGIEPLLQYLQSNNIHLAVNTNKNEAITKCIMDKLFSNYKFSCIAGDHPSIRKKPDPAGARWIAEKLGVAPEQCIYVGDSEIDLWTARNANMVPVSVLWGFRSKKELIQAGAQFIVREPMELISLLE